MRIKTMSDEERIAILEKSFDFLEQIIQEAYVEDDEAKTRENILKVAKKIFEKSKSELDRLALKDALEKLDDFSFMDIAEIYDSLN